MNVKTLDKLCTFAFLIILVYLIGVFYQTARHIGSFDAGDSFAYAELGEYLLHNRYILVKPANEYMPQTLFAPIYALFVTPLLSMPIPFGSYMLPFLQLLLILAGSVLLFVILRYLFTPTTALLGSVFFIFFPFNIIHATFIMSETLTTFLVTFYVYTFYFFTRKTIWATSGLLVFIAAVLVLTRYAFTPWFILTFGLYLWDLKHKPKYHHIYGIFGLVIIASWMLFNYRIFGYWTLSTVSGRHLYNNAVSTGHLIPPPGIPKTEYFYSKMPVKLYPMAIFLPWWDVQSMIKDGSLSERQLDQVFMDAAVSAILAHPFQYVFHVMNMIFITPLTAPKFMTQNMNHVSLCDTSTCRVTWNSYLCQPAEILCSANSKFVQFTKLNQLFYPVGALICFILAIIGMVTSFRKKHFFWTWITILFVFQHAFQSATEWLESRFLIPLYPVYILLIVLGIRSLFSIPLQRIAIHKNISAHHGNSPVV